MQLEHLAARVGCWHAEAALADRYLTGRGVPEFALEVRAEGSAGADGRHRQGHTPGLLGAAWIVKVATLTLAIVFLWPAHTQGLRRLLFVAEDAFRWETMSKSGYDTRVPMYPALLSLREYKNIYEWEDPLLSEDTMDLEEEAAELGESSEQGRVTGVGGPRLSVVARAARLMEPVVACCHFMPQ